MSTIERKGTSSGETAARGQPTDLLCCETCGHRAAADGGDWAVTEREAAGDRLLAYECPDCWTTVLVEPVAAGRLQTA